jgi:hypothetical protein
MERGMKAIESMNVVQKTKVKRMFLSDYLSV